MSVAQVFNNQAEACESLGSGFTARLLRALGAAMTPGQSVADKILAWPGDISAAGDSIALRLAGGMHALVLSARDKKLAAAYPPNPSISDRDLGLLLDNALISHEKFLLNWINSPPQTNEIARSAVLIAAGHLLSNRYEMPLRLFELGASAGLNLLWDQVALDVNGEVFGPKNASIRLSPDWKGMPPTRGNPHIIARAGVDLNPLNPANPDDRLRLLAYIWPDQPERLERIRRACDLAMTTPVSVVQSDAIDWLECQLNQPESGAVTIIYHTIAWQYFPKSTQDRGKSVIEKAGQQASSTAPIAWLSMEADGQKSSAALALRLWPGDIQIELGRADFHGRWIDWRAPRFRTAL